MISNKFESKDKYHHIRRTQNYMNPQKLKQYYQSKQIIYREKIEILSKEIANYKMLLQELETENHQLKNCQDPQRTSHINFGNNNNYNSKVLHEDIKRLQMLVEIITNQKMRGNYSLENICDTLERTIYRNSQKEGSQKKGLNLSIESLFQIKQKKYEFRIQTLSRQIRELVADLDYKIGESQDLKQEVFRMSEQVHNFSCQVKSLENKLIQTKRQQEPSINLTTQITEYRLKYQQLEVINESLRRQLEEKKHRQKYHHQEMEMKQREKLRWKERYEQAQKEKVFTTQKLREQNCKLQLKLISS